MEDLLEKLKEELELLKARVKEEMRVVPWRIENGLSTIEEVIEEMEEELS